MTLFECSTFVSILGGAVAGAVAAGSDGVLLAVLGFLGGGCFGLATYLILTVVGAAIARMFGLGKDDKSSLQNLGAGAIFVMTVASPVVSPVLSYVVVSNLVGLLRA